MYSDMAIGEAEAVERILDAFDCEATIIRAALRSAVGAELDRHLRRAASLLSRRLREPFSGTGQAASGTDQMARALRFIQRFAGESPGHLAQLAEEAWLDATDSDNAAYNQCVRGVIRWRWEVTGPALENGGGIAEAARACPVMVLAGEYGGPKVVCLPIPARSADTGSLEQRIAEIDAVHQRILPVLARLLGNEKIRTGETDLIASLADLGTVVLTAREREELAESIGTLAMPGLLATAGVAAVVAAVVDVGNKAMAEREQAGFSQLEACREAVECDFLRKVDDLLSLARSLMHARLCAILSPKQTPERRLRMERAISDLQSVRDEMLAVLGDA